jgi:putative hydrolase of the HAD superfamily
MHFSNVKTVFLDIDDTLWENNLFFLQSQSALFEIGRACGHTHAATSALLEYMEDINIPYLGYGYNSYEQSLIMAVRALVARGGMEHMHGAFHARILRWTHFLRNHPIVWLEGVSETLPLLTKSFNTIIVTKGHEGDQSAKVNRCGLKHLFFGVEVVPHKYPSCYTRLLEKYCLKAEETVMVGNSPRSDINNAKKAGLRTIYVPHPQTWYREMEPIRDDGPETVKVESFRDVLAVLGVTRDEAVALPMTAGV